MHHSYHLGDHVIITHPAFVFSAAQLPGTITKVYLSASNFYEAQPEGYPQAILVHADDLTPAEQRSEVELCA